MKSLREGKSSTWQLASLLRGTADDKLLQLLKLRSVTAYPTPSAAIRDFFDLADSLLSSDSLQHCLTRLDRRTLTAILQLGTAQGGTVHNHTSKPVEAATLDHLCDLGLVRSATAGFAVWPEVTAQLARWPDLGLPDVSENTPEPGTPILHSPNRNDSNSESSNTLSNAAEVLASERAFNTTTAVSELLFKLEREPLRLLNNGALGRPGTRWVADALRIAQSEVASVIDLAESARLVVQTHSQLVPSEDHRNWLELAPAGRWVHIADAWANAHWPGIRAQITKRSFLQDSDIGEWLQWNYPGGRDWLGAQSATRLKEAETLGLTAHGLLSSFGSTLLSGQINQALAQLAAQLPAPLKQLYLQHDLTAMATGPLDSRIDTRLRTMAEVDGHTIASRYRFSADSVARAIGEGETAPTILEFLASITLSGIPQPLEYLISETAARHGALRVGPLPDDNQHARAYVRSESPVLLHTVLLDRTIAALRLQPQDAETIISACSPDHLFAMLAEARYPVALEDSSRRLVAPRPIVASRPKRSGKSTSQKPPRPDPIQSLIARLRMADADLPTDSSQAWLVRQLDSAIRSKSSVLVSVRMPNGNLVDYELEPTSVAGGRLRARDTRSEIERTLPLSSIAEIRQI